jgi:2-(1,2-epoxy-1,2-dihydrophenyl)acetyl-CoA isomerase
MGMIYKVLPADGFEDACLQLASGLAEMPTYALALTKQLFNESLSNSLEKQLEVESKWQIEAGSSNDYKEGVSAFVEKRKPVFKGN